MNPYVGMARKQDARSNGCIISNLTAITPLEAGFALVTTYLSFSIAAVGNKNVYIARTMGEVIIIISTPSVLIRLAIIYHSCIFRYNIISKHPRAPFLQSPLK